MHLETPRLDLTGASRGRDHLVPKSSKELSSAAQGISLEREHNSLAMTGQTILKKHALPL